MQHFADEDISPGQRVDSTRFSEPPDANHPLRLKYGDNLLQMLVTSRIERVSLC